MVYSGKFEAPGPGAWERESTHVVRPLSRYLQEIWPAAMMRGFKRFTHHYGLLLDHLEIAVVEGFLYTAARPVGAPKGAKGPPPKPIFKLMTWFHPEIRRRIKRAPEVFARKVWRDEVRTWDETDKPAVIAENLRLQRVDPGALSDDALLGHLADCRTVLDRAIERHHRYNGCCMIPIGEYLVEVGDWTGLGVGELLAPLRGASPTSAGADDELARLVTAIRADEAAKKHLTLADPAEAIAALRSAAGEVGEAANAYLYLVGHRILTGYDVADRTALEIPDALVRAVRSAVEADPSRDDVGRRTSVDTKVRDAVPAVKRGQFDELLAEARLVYRVRDERCVLNDAHTTGLARRALLEVGKRLVVRDRLEDAAHVVDLRHREIVEAMAGRGGLGKGEVAAYARYRTEKTFDDAPEFLGDRPSGPPPAEWLPRDAARLQRAIVTILSALFKPRDKGTESHEPAAIVRGLAVGGGTYEGIARLVLDAADFPRVQRGDVLVARATTPSYNTLLPLLGALVTDRGGLLSHPAIVAREYGLPGVVGCLDATTKIPEGARVCVDGTKGEVRIL